MVVLRQPVLWLNPSLYNWALSLRPPLYVKATAHWLRDLPPWQDPHDNPGPDQAGLRVWGLTEVWRVPCLPGLYLATWPRSSKGTRNGFRGHTPAACQEDMGWLEPAFSGA